MLQATVCILLIQNQGDVIVIHYVASILELVVPLLDHPSETFLASLEEDIIKLTMKQGQMVHHTKHILLFCNKCIFGFRSFRVVLVV